MATENSFIRRAAVTIVVIALLVSSSLMLSGGCSDDGPGSCNGNDQVRLACPAVSYETISCIGYVFDIIDDSVEPPVIVDGFNINFKRKCKSIDCFTLECQDITSDSDALITEAEIIIETVDGLPVGGDTDETTTPGEPNGRIIIDGENFLLESIAIIVP